MKVYDDDEDELVDVDLDDGEGEAAVVSTRNDPLSKSLQVGDMGFFLRRTEFFGLKNLSYYATVNDIRYFIYVPLSQIHLQQ